MIVDTFKKVACVSTYITTVVVLAYLGGGKLGSVRKYLLTSGGKPSVRVYTLWRPLRDRTVREMVVLRMVVLTCVLHASLALVLQPRATVAGRARTLGQLCELRTARALGGPRGARVTARVVRPVMADASIQAQIKQRMKTAMKGGPDAKKELSAVRLMVAAMETRQKEENLESLSDEQAQAVLSKLAKMRKESIAMFEDGGKAEAAAAEQFELTILQEYLPTMADEATVRVWIGEAIAEACPDGADKKMMGKVMGALMRAHKGEFDGKAANKWVGEMLAS